ncbi:UDP-Glycosyltransferase superfamily protein [Klebsormidium nitens]|uniref:UDP-Glycosyltransferase superfamily protein n=1 Tax=Klebsormidium nitens TaxID=105231 RepID=A0A0U9HLD8_KLENI|nr:UDP-Glycosyltransferase superfamily protein [Klebsormidium nitens]|eukprot:GAQ90052.1 UDP-Glycosyltransferase superfamily protein [Klebsormidium nitens]
MGRRRQKERAQQQSRRTQQVSSYPCVEQSEESSTPAAGCDASGSVKGDSAAHSTRSSVAAGGDSMNDSSTGWGGPPLMIAVLVAGTFGDMQPFVVLSQELQKAGHQIRLATHVNYKTFVEDQGVEFFPLGGDPEFLSKLMVKNRGFLPAGVSELSRQRQEFHNILFSTWDACTRPTPASNRPFLANCIIANPPAAGHVHCAEKLGVPLHMVFTMPWSRTWSYPHPLSYTRYRSGVRTLRNRLSYFATETFIYSGTSDIVQKFRVDLLGLEKAPTLGGAAMTLHSLRVPFTYAWSPALAPKPADWGPHIAVTGFLFLEERHEQRYDPPPALAAFLAEGPPPVYIGFGSMVAKDPQKLTNTIFSAVAEAGVRAVMNRGWGKFGSSDPPRSIHLIEHTPHSWLFPRCSALVHHGGAGTTAAGALAGRPQLVVPFFGDQAMWGELIEQHGCGPHPIPANQLSEKSLVAALRHMQAGPVQAAAARLAALLANEKGAQYAAAAFHRHLPRRAMLCDLDATRQVPPVPCPALGIASQRSATPGGPCEPDWQSRLH